MDTCLPGNFWAYHRTMEWWEETAHALVLMHDWKQRKKLEATIRDPVQLAVERPKFEAYEQDWASPAR